MSVRDFAVAHRSPVPSPDTRGDVFGPIGLCHSFAAGEEIYAQEEETDLIYRVVAGAVRTTQLLPDGRRQVGDFYYPGDLFGLEAGPEHRFSAEALCPCEIVVVKKAALRSYGEDVERFIWAATARELQRTQEHLTLLARRTACEKLASFLLGLADRIGPGVDGTVGLPMGRQDIADYLGLTIETVSRMFTQLQAEGVIELVGLRRVRLRSRSALAQIVMA